MLVNLSTANTFSPQPIALNAKKKKEILKSNHNTLRNMAVHGRRIQNIYCRDIYNCYKLFVKILRKVFVLFRLL